MEIKELIENAKLPSPSPVVMRIHEAIETGNASDIAQIIQTDQALSACTLKLANSAIYGPRSEIKTVREAVIRIGTIDLWALFMATETAHVFFGVSSKHYDLHAAWRHSLFTAAVALLLSGERGVGTPAELFLAGLLHDIGRLLMVKQAPVEYGDVIERVEAGAGKLEAEIELFGFDHAEVGARLLESWALPTALVECVGQHHAPCNALSTAPEIVAAANLVTHYQQNTPGEPLPEELDLEPLLEKAEQRYEQYRSVIGSF